jgi:hypothetical protein
MEDTSKPPLAQVLARFENAVLSPVIPGELADWAEEAFHSTAELKYALDANDKTGHREIYQTIADSDPEMLARVEQLQGEDDELVAAANELFAMAKTMRTVGGTVERDEERASKLLQGFVAAAGALLVRVKKQEKALEVWLRESQTRDKGVKD